MFQRKNKKVQKSNIVTSVVQLPPPPPKTVTSLSKYFGNCLSLVLGIVTFVAILIVLFVYVKLFAPPCPTVYNRECNGRGTCSLGICHCDLLFSGPACTDTQIPGYKVQPNTECSNHGFANPLILLVEQCNSEKTVGGWTSSACIEYTNAVRSLIAAAGDPSEISLSITIPLCTCDIGWGSTNCAASPCPFDENGLVCGGNGNTSVGLVQNSTNAGQGCQCESIFAFYESKYVGWFTPDVIEMFLSNYNVEYRQRYCGHLKQVINETTNEPIPNLVLAYTLPSDYKCYCSIGWTGVTCTEGKCPMIEERICGDNGIETHGQGIVTNYSHPIGPNGIRCSLQCIDGYTSCGDKCASEDDINRAQFCIVPLTCPPDSPLRCEDGSCVSFPVTTSNTKCPIGSSYGSIDYSQIDIVKTRYKCTNITNSVTFTSCFLNTTRLSSITGYVPQGGFYIEIGNTLTVDYGSQLVYFEMVTTASGLTITTWDNQKIVITSEGFASGFFTYPSTGEWKTPIYTTLFLDRALNTVNELDTIFRISPMPWNYSGNVLYNSSYAHIRVTNTVAQQTFIFNAISSDINIYPFTGARPSNGVLIKVKPSIIDNQPLWYYPQSGQQVPNENCLSIPSQCSWYVTTGLTAIRNLDSTLFVCNGTVSGPNITTVPCDHNYYSFASQLIDYIYIWETVLIATSKLEIPLNIATFDKYETNDTSRTTWPFTISWDLPSQYEGPILVQDVIFLTQKRVTYPCVCGTTPYSKNQTTLNEDWWIQTDLRAVDLNAVTEGDYVLIANYSGGEKTLVRSIIAAIDIDRGTLTALSLNSHKSLEVFVKNSRVISYLESTSGTPDCNLALYPFHCPSGGCSTASSFIDEIPVGCNCTYSQPIANCSCSDPLPSYWGCQCNTTIPQCQCGPPSNGEFERLLSDKIVDITTSDCSCVLYSLFNSTNSSVISRDGTTNRRDFFFNTTQIPTHIIVTTVGSGCLYSQFHVVSSSYLFSGVDVETGFDYTIETEYGECLSYLTLYLFDLPAFSTLSVYSNVTIELAILEFSIGGFSLLQTDNAFEITASSNNEDASNINLQNNSYWLASTDLRQYPTWIQIEFQNRYYVDFTKVIFYQAGELSTNFTLPLRIYLESTNDGINWFVIGSWGVYVQTGGWEERTLSFNSTIAYSTYRLIAPNGIFGVRQWYLYSKQICTCLDGTHLVVNFNSTDGLISISEQLERVQFLYDHTGNTTDGLCLDENDCTLLNRNVTFNGECNDAIYAAYQMGIPLTSTNLLVARFDINNITTNVTYEEYDHVTNISGFPYDVVQFITSSGVFYTDAELITNFYDWYEETGQPINNFTDPDNYIMYLFKGTLQVYPQPIPQFWYWVEDTFIFDIYVIEYSWSDLVSSGKACLPGTDTFDCGSNARTIPLMNGYGCTPTPEQLSILFAIENTTIIVDKTYVASQLTELTNYWNAFYQSLILSRKITRLQLDFCEYQTCPKELPIKCKNGDCVAFKSHCDIRYNCPGNGCIELTDASTTIAYRCACKRGHAGDACQYGPTLPATPLLALNEGGTPPSEVARCGGPPPFREKPPVINVGKEYTNAEIEQINNKVRGGCAPKSVFDIDYHCVMPSDAPFGAILTRIVTITELSPLLTPQIRTIRTSCPCMRRGFGGEYIFLTNDVASRELISGAPTWKVYYDSNTGEEVTFPWLNGICTYDDFPYPCPDGQCGANQGECVQLANQRPLCNNRGDCRADATCECYSDYTTFAISKEFSASISTPYNPDPTVWELNWNWKNYPLLQCTARNCQLDNCKIPMGCYTGTPSLNFADRLFYCPPSTGRANQCSNSINQCIAGINLSPPLVCSGNGIPRIKDFSGLQYCACGTPISLLENITEVSQITQLKPNGYGGIACTDYYADLTLPLIFAPWNHETNEPYRSLITGIELPGYWLKGITIFGARPEDRLLWEKCCPNGERLEYCPLVPCNVPPNIKCLTPQQCLAISQTAPLVYPCNGHGVARADGTCLCTVDEDEGHGYTYAFDQFDYKGCYNFVQCPISLLSGKACNFINGCTQPDKWRHPMPWDIYLDQQKLTCGLDGKGQPSNITYANEISANTQNFESLLLQALGDIAISVIEAITSLAGCICVSPDDTQEEHCCMIDNDIYYKYGQNFNRPYLLDVSVDGYPGLTNGVLGSIPNFPPQIILTVGQSLHMTLNNNDSTIMSSIRGYALGTADVSFTTDTGIICPPASFTPYSSGDFLYWTLGTNSGDRLAHFCGPTYVCVNSHSYPLYASKCGVKADSQECIAYKKSTCLANPSNVYWPPGSLNSYEGCTIEADPDDCTCCNKVESQYPITSGKFTMTVTTGSVIIGQLRFYGYTSTALVMPQGLRQMLDYDFRSECQDDKYLREFLGGDGQLYYPSGNLTTGFIRNGPNQSLQQRQAAIDICNVTGGHLAITESRFVDQPTGTALIGSLSNMCQKIGNNTKCWVNAINTFYNDTVTPRSTLFSATCTFYGCYEPTTTGITFFANSSTYYQTNSVPYRNSIIALATVNTQMVNFYVGIKRNLWFYDATVYNGGASTFDNLFAVQLIFLNAGSCNIGINVDFRPIQAMLSEGDNYFEKRRTYLYGELISLFDIVDKCSTAATAVDDQVLSNTWRIINVYKANGPNDREGYAATIVPFISKPFDGDYKRGIFVNPQGTVTKNYAYGSGGAKTYSNQPVTSGRFTRSSFKRNACEGTLSSDCHYPQWIAVYPYEPGGNTAVLRYASMNIQTPLANSGEIGLDKVYGYTDQPFMPLSATTLTTIEVIIDGPNTAILKSYLNGIPTYDTSTPPILVVKATPFVPVYTTLILYYVIFNGNSPYHCSQPASIVCSTPLTTNLNLFTQILKCSVCQTVLSGEGYIWDQLAYPLTGNTGWISSFRGPVPFIQISYRTDLSDPTSPFNVLNLQRLSLNGVNPPSPLNSINVFVHQTNYINTKTINTNPRYVQWFIPICLVVTANNLEVSVCDGPSNQFICVIDYVRYAIVSGYQCIPGCGSNTRSGGEPSLYSCFEDNPLANETAFPFQHAVLAAYESGTLDLFATRYNLNQSSVDFGNTSIIMGFAKAWEKWSAGYSSRKGQLSINTRASQDWCDMSLVRNWPIDCGVQVNPQTNEISRQCATKSEYCNLFVDVPENSEMLDSNRPKIILAVTAASSLTNPTCGPNVDLAGYAQNDKYGGIQSDLVIYNQILLLNSEYIQIAISTTNPIWYNSGKSNTRYKFMWNLTATVSGNYVLNPCQGCQSPSMEVFIYPLNIDYSFPSNIISVEIPLVISSNLQQYVANFTVTVEDTGIETVDGIEYPILTFTGIGYRFHNLQIGSSIILFNPTITDETTRFECTTRNPEKWHEPKFRIQSTAPRHTCIITEEEQILNTGSEIGKCVCGSASAGETCDCIAVNGLVCGGWGDTGPIMAPDGKIVQTSTNDLGCYVYSEKYSDCKTIDLGRAIRTLLVPGSIFDSPSIYIEVLPASGVPVFETFPNTEPLTIVDEEIQCTLEGMFLPYYYTPDELRQLTLNSIGEFPVLMGINISASNSSTWVWESPIDPSYFIYSNNGTESSAFGTCESSPVDVCSMVNFNNYAFDALVTEAFVHDGNTNTAVVSGAGGTIVWDINSSLEVTVYVFGSTSLTITCTGLTACTAVPKGGINAQYTCRCPTRSLTYGAGTFKEIQIFNSNDLMRSTSYYYP